MPTTYQETVTTMAESSAAIKQAILACSDWTHLQLTTGTAATTLASAASAAAVSISTVATIPSGSYVVIGNGAANPEVRLTTGVSGSGPFTVTFAKPLVASYSSGAAVGVGSIVKATTTRGAQMVLDLSDAAATTLQLTFAMYRTHNGTTGVDKINRYMSNMSLTATTNTVRARVSASKEHLYIEFEGPRNGEAGYDVNYGNARRFMFMGDIVPYFVGDTIPAVVVIAADSSNSSSSGRKAVVSRNQGDQDSWVPATLLTLCVPSVPLSTNDVDGLYHNSWQQFSKGDGKVYLSPWVVAEDKDGMRGRIGQMFFTGWNWVNTVSPDGWSPIGFQFSEGARVSYGGTTYIVQKPISTNVTTNAGALALGALQAYRTNDFSPLIAVPYSTP